MPKFAIAGLDSEARRPRAASDFSCGYIFY